MQPISEIVKEIGFPIWMFWGLAIFLIGIVVINNMHQQKMWLTLLTINALLTLVITIALIFYSANGSVKRKKESEQQLARWQGELAVLEQNAFKENPTLNLDIRLQSIEGIIGYLDQSIKMEYEPENITQIVLFLSKEIKKIRDNDKT